MVEDSSCCSNKNVNSLSELTNLIFNVDTTIDSDNFELALVVLQFAHFVGDLKSKLSSRGQHDSLNFSSS